jgi:hypothetical protein
VSVTVMFSLSVITTGGSSTVITVESLVLAPADPPPLTFATFTWGEVALVATFTVAVIGG